MTTNQETAGGRVRLLILPLLTGSLAAAAVVHLSNEPPPSRDVPRMQLVQGSVLLDGRPVSGARVRIKGTRHTARTDDAGKFRITTAVPAAGRVTAWKEGHFIGGADLGDNPLTIELKSLPREDFADYEWIDPAPDPAHEHNCGNCHAAIYDEWLASSHSRSLSNRRFLNLVEGTDFHGRPGVGWNLQADYPEGTGVCTSCHGPSVPFDDAGYHQPAKVSGVHAHGVHCDYCHKIESAPAEGIGRAHGRFGLKLLRPREGLLFFGPLDDVDRGEDVFNPLYRQSRYCASCHEGVLFGVHVYSTYSEWLDSPAAAEGRQCQDCHMAPTGRLTNLAPGRGGIERDPATLSSHRFPGSTEKMLNRALQVTLQAERTEDGLEVAVTVTAENVGHRVPTGFIDHHLILAVEPVDAPGGPLAGSRLTGLSGEALAGKAGKLFAKVLVGADAEKPTPFWKGINEIRDTRLVPGQPDCSRWRFAAGAGKLRLRLIYRRFWEQVAQTKDWPNNEIVLLDEQITLDGRTRWSWPGRD